MRLQTAQQYREVVRQPGGPDETRQPPHLGDTIRWSPTVLGFTRLGRVIALERWYEGKDVGALVICCVDLEREGKEFGFGVSSPDWEVIEHAVKHPDPA